MDEANESKIDEVSQSYDDSETEVLIWRVPRSTLLGVPFPTKFVAGGNDGWGAWCSGPGVTGREAFGVFSCDLLWTK